MKFRELYEIVMARVHNTVMHHIKLELDYPYLIFPATRFDNYVFVLLPAELADVDGLNSLFDRDIVTVESFSDGVQLLTLEEAEKICREEGFSLLRYFDLVKSHKYIQ